MRFRLAPPRIRLGLVSTCVAAAFVAGLSFSVPDAKAPTVKLPRGLTEGAQNPLQKTVTPDQVPEGALVPQGPTPAIGIFATGDVIGYLEPCG